MLGPSPPVDSHSGVSVLSQVQKPEVKRSVIVKPGPVGAGLRGSDGIMPPDGAFTAALLLLLSSVSALTVLPPRNVTVSCENLKTWVSWEFGEQQPSTSFRVETVSSDGRHVNVTTEHQYDLTRFIWESQAHFMGFHSVNVTALQQGGQSQPVQSKSFTFNKDRPAHKYCVLDFPPVDVTAGDSSITVTFQNPFHFYSELKKADKLQVFAFDISFDQMKNGSKIPQVQKDEYTSYCKSTEVICRYVLLHGGEQCIKVKGRLYSSNRAEEVEVRETGRICPTKPSKAHEITLSILLTVFVLIIGVLTISICIARAWTQKTQKTPKALDLEPYDDERNLLNPVIEEVVSPVMVMERSRSSSVSSEDGGLQDSGTCSDLRYMTGSLYMVGGLSEGGDQEAMEMMYEEPADEEPADEEEQRAVGNYDRQHVVRVDLGGDTAEGYRER